MADLRRFHGTCDEWVAPGVANQAIPCDIRLMPAADLLALEQRLEACLLELDSLQRARPKAPGALRRAEMGRQIDDALTEIRELEQEIALARASTLADAAVQLRRLAAWIDRGNETPARLLASALGAVEKAVERP